MRSFIIAAIAILAFASAANSAATAPYKLDAKGKCHGANGQFAKQSLCAAPGAAPAPKHCKDPKTHKFTKCTAPGAVPA
jgi:hypothetical protein